MLNTIVRVCVCERIRVRVCVCEPYSRPYCCITQIQIPYWPSSTRIVASSTRIVANSSVLWRVHPYCGEFIRIGRIHQERSVMTSNAITRFHRYALVSKHVKHTYEAPSASVKRAWDWSVTAPRRSVHVSEARLGLASHRTASLSSCQ